MKFSNLRYVTKVQRIIKTRCYSSNTKQIQKYDLKSTRNIGIIAHIDAGKTTTTERMLYYSGFTPSMGEVHDGDTVMDYMEQERERGITITSASITFPWKKHKINLIDTPGHVDFTFEVERSLSVLDSAITILDASAGVQAQTLTVWTQADCHQVPRIIYLNKMDKSLANVSFCLDSIIDKLCAKPLLIHLPLFKDNDKFYGIVDVVTMEKFCWKNELRDDGSHFDVVPLDKERDESLFKKASQMRENLINTISDLDEQFADIVIDCDHLQSISAQQINNCLRRITIKQLAFPVLCGSSYKNVGVQTLLDSVIKYLPSPLEKVRDITKYYGNELCAFAFKIIHHKRLGALTFLRIYSGHIKQQQSLYNLSQERSEKINKLYIAFADDFEETNSVSYGNIAVVTGLQNTITGDTLVVSSKIADKVKSLYKKNSDNDDHLLAGMTVPDPVFFCSIEAPSTSKQKDLELALDNLQKEDPTFKVTHDSDSGQLIIKGMGELHLEVIKDRILKEYGIEAYLGQLQISYKESIVKSCEYIHIYEKRIGGTKNFVKITLVVKPSSDEKAKKKVRVVVTQENDLQNLRQDYLKAIESGVVLALNNGPILSYPVINVSVDLLGLEVGKGTSHTIISAATSQCVNQAITHTTPVLLEPYMKLEITSKENYIGSIISDLSMRRSHLGRIQTRGDFRLVTAITPLSELINYSTVLRTFTSGNANFTMEFDSYKIMNENEQKKIIQKITGFG